MAKLPRLRTDHGGPADAAAVFGGDWQNRPRERAQDEARQPRPTRNTLEPRGPENKPQGASRGREVG